MFFYSDLSDSDHWKFVYLHIRTLNALNYNIISEFVIFQNDKQRLLLAIQSKRGVFPLFYFIKQCTLRICAGVLSAWSIFTTLKFLFSVIFLVQIFAAYNNDMQSSYHHKCYPRWNQQNIPLVRITYKLEVGWILFL